MDTRQLKYFVAIVECGSFAEASRRLYIAQPALSQQIARLEDEIGAPLLIRSAKGVSPTSNGFALFRHAKFVLRQLDHALTLARQPTAEITGRVCLGIAPTTACQIGMPFLERMQEKYPGILVNIVEGLSGHLQHMASNGELDMAILFTNNAVVDWQCTPLLDEELFVILPVGSSIFARNRDSITLSEIQELPLFLPSKGHGLRRRIDIEFERLAISLMPVSEIDSLPMLMGCLAQGLGATIKPISAINVHGTALAKNWRCLKISDAAISRTNYLFALPPQRASEALMVAHRELLSLAHEHVCNGSWHGVELITPSKARGLSQVPTTRTQA